jgi:hypothetical protein
MVRRVDHPTRGGLCLAAASVGASLGTVLASPTRYAFELDAAVGASADSPRLHPIRSAVRRAVELTRPIGTAGEAFTALATRDGRTLPATCATASRGAEPPQFAPSAATIFGAAVITASRSRRHASF